MHVVVCIVGFRNAADIAQCLDALQATTYRDFEVVICENGGVAAYDALRTTCPDRLGGGQPVTIELASENLGYAGGVNACIAARPDADAWWILNPDTFPEPDALEALVTRLAEGDCAAVGGVLLDGAGVVQAVGGRWRNLLARAESLGRGERIPTSGERTAIERQMDYISGASMLVGRPMVDVVGLMRDDYFLYSEEVEWCLRARAHGLRLGFTPAARVVHGRGTTTGSGDAITRRPRLPIYLDERNKLHVVRDTTPARFPVAVIGSFAMLAMRFARRGAWRQWGYGLAGWAAGIRNARGLPPWMR